MSNITALRKASLDREVQIRLAGRILNAVAYPSRPNILHAPDSPPRATR